MTGQPQDLVSLEHIRQLLAEVRTIDEVKNIRGKPQLAKGYAKKKGLAQEIIVDGSAIKVEAERKLGQLLRKTPLAKASAGNQHTGKLDRSHSVTGPIQLRDLGITKSESSRAQRIADIPKAAFDRYVKENVEAGREPTEAGALRLARELEVAESVVSRSHIDDAVVENLDELIEQDNKFSTIYADPPWPCNNQGTRAATRNHYPAMTLDRIRAEPVAKLAAEDSHLHLWTTNSFLPDALSIVDAWGFTYKSLFVWVKPSLGIGNYWRVSHELLLFGTRGNRPFLDNGQRSWIEAKRTGHSRKPSEVRGLIQKVSPGPYLEMYGREAPQSAGWTVYGNQIGSEDRP